MMSRDTHRSSGTHHGAGGVPGGWDQMGTWGLAVYGDTRDLPLSILWCMEGWEEAAVGWIAALDVEQGALIPIESFLHHQH